MESGSLGFIFHVGLYNYFAYDDVRGVERRNIMNGSEWYYSRLNATGYRKPGGTEATKRHHAEQDVEYFDAPLNITRETICDWLEFCKNLGATYVIITSKHHDGYCLWPTSNEHHSDVDIIQIFKEEAEKAELKFGIYYSWMEVDHSMTIDYFNSVCCEQINELIEYEPDFFWFDGDWEIKQKKNLATMDVILNKLHEKGITFNDRLGKRDSYPVEPDFRVFSDRYIPKEPINNWQHINTIGVSWGYNKEQTKKHYKTGKQLTELYLQVTELGGSLCLNIATDHEGTVDPNELESLVEFYQIVNDSN